MAASGILAGLKLVDEIVYCILRRDIMQESTVYRSIRREVQEEEKRAIALTALFIFMEYSEILKTPA